MYYKVKNQIHTLQEAIHLL